MRQKNFNLLKEAQEELKCIKQGVDNCKKCEDMQEGGYTEWEHVERHANHINYLIKQVVEDEGK